MPKFYHLDIDPVDLQGEWEAAQEAEHDNAVADSHRDKWGHTGLPRDDAKFLAHCRGELSKEDYEQRPERKKVLVDCPDGRKDCAVAHYEWVE